MNDAEMTRDLKAGRIFLVSERLQRELQSATGITRQWLLYNLGVVSRSRLGRGVDCKKWFDQLGREPNIVDASPVLKEMRANAFENAMLLSLSFEEYEANAERLRALRPGAAILSGQVPVFAAAQKAGRPWWEMMRAIAESYYRDGEPTDPKMYGEAVSTYQLLLANRRQLRLDRAAWGRVVQAYGTLGLRLGSTTFPAGSVHGGPDGPDDPTPLVSVSTPYIEEFLRENPNHAEATQILEWQQTWFSRIAASSHSARQSTDSEARAVSRDSKRSLLPILNAILTAVATAVGLFALARYAFDDAQIGMAMGLIGGLVALGAAAAKTAVQRARREASADSADDGHGEMSRLDAALSMRGGTPARCSLGHEMQPFEDDGVLLAKCPHCGAVKPFPGVFHSSSVLLRVAAKYDKFEM